MQYRWDVLGLGCVAVDDLLYVDAFPAPDSKVRVVRRERHGGGQTGTALAAAARLGAKCAYAGRLGFDAESEFVVENFRRAGVDLEPLQRTAGVRPIHCTILVVPGSRTVLYDLEGTAGASVDYPAEEIIRAARVLYVDQYGIEGMIRAARIARGAGNAVVADLENDSWPGFRELLELVNHLIIARDFAAKLTGRSAPAEAIGALWNTSRAAVVVTCGAEGCWYRGAGEMGARHQPAYPVSVVDSTGCGDVFHGVYAALLAEGGMLEERIRFATVAAGLKAKHPGAQAGIPARVEAERALLSW